MNVVDPIRDIRAIRQIESYLKRDNTRNWLLFITGINTALRISDIRELKVRDVKFKTELRIKVEKTGKCHIVQLNLKLRKAFRKYTKDMHLDDYLFKSREGANKPLSRVQAYNIIRDVCNMYGIDRAGTHTLRKTYGYHFYKQTKDIATLQEILGHSSQRETLKYIGIEQESIDKAMNTFVL